jgi:ABC-type amino acid transport substrate-binding protein
MRPGRFIFGKIAVAGVVLLATACGGGGGGGGASPTGSAAAFMTLKPGVLTVGSCLAYKPFEYYQSGQLKGFDVEIMQNVADRLGLKLEWVKANFKTIFTALDGGQFDAVAAASTITPEREQVVDFSIPYYPANQSFTANVTKTPDVKNVDDLKSGDVVGVQAGTTGEIWAKENLEPKGVQLKEYTEAPTAFTDLEAGNIVGVINDEPSSRAEVETRPDLEVVQPIVTKENYGIALRKQNPDLEKAVNDALRDIIADGTYEKLFVKYFPDLTLPSEFKPSG